MSFNLLSTIEHVFIRHFIFIKLSGSLAAVDDEVKRSHSWSFASENVKILSYSIQTWLGQWTKHNNTQQRDMQRRRRKRRACRNWIEPFVWLWVRGWKIEVKWRAKQNFLALLVLWCRIIQLWLRAVEVIFRAKSFCYLIGRYHFPFQIHHH